MRKTVQERANKAKKVQSTNNFIQYQSTEKGTIQFDSQAKEMKSRTSRFKVNKNICEESSLKGEWSSMDDGMTLVQDHVTGLSVDVGAELDVGVECEILA